MNSGQMGHNRLFERRVILNTGKGGVGKSTLTAAMAMLAASRGKRVLVVEFAGQCNMATLLGGPLAGYEEVERQPNLFTLSVTPEASMEEYLTRELHSRKLYQLIFRNQFTGPFLAAVPGLEDLMSIGKVMDLERSVRSDGSPTWDLILVDAPATGQGLNLLRVPRAMMDMTRVGPFFSNTKLIHDLLMNRSRTVVNLITLAEEMPVNETVELFHHLRNDLDIPLGYLIVNNLRPMLLDPYEASFLPALLAREQVAGESHARVLAAVIRSASEVNRRAQLERSYMTRLTSEVSLPLVEIPALARRNLGPAEVRRVAELLAQELRERDSRGGGP